MYNSGSGDKNLLQEQLAHAELIREMGSGADERGSKLQKRVQMARATYKQMRVQNSDAIYLNLTLSKVRLGWVRLG